MSAAESPEGLQFFESRIRPVLADQCYRCHSTSARSLKGGLYLDSREGIRRGGESGKPAVVPGDLKASQLIKAIRWDDTHLQMPPKTRLGDRQIADFEKWVAMGAPDPREGRAPVAKGEAVPVRHGRDFWSFQPLRTVAPPKVKDAGWCRTEADRFILARLESKGIAPNPEVERRKLIRRLHLDVIGFPPTPEQVEAFVADQSPKAWERVVDEALASPHYGERWARHWLDLARFGESHGYEQDYDRHFAYHYRDFLIRALNRDLPFNQFAQWQIAGDELEPDNSEAWAATGFLAAGTHATQITANQAEKERYDELDDKINTIGTAFLGLSIGCARCHDHKFDPISAREYYNLAAIFTKTVRSDHDVQINAAETRAKIAAWETGRRPLADALAKFEREQLPGRFERWLGSERELPQPAWLVLQADKTSASASYYTMVKFHRQEDGSYLTESSATPPDTCKFEATITGTNVSAIRLDVLAHDKLPGRGPGWAADGAFALSEFSLDIAPVKAGEGKPAAVKLKDAMATFSAKGADVGGAISAANRSAWRVNGRTGRDHTATFAAEKPFGFPGGTKLTFTLKFSGGNLGRHDLGRFRIAVSSHAERPEPLAATFFAKDHELAMAALAKAADKWNAKETAALRRLYATTDADWRKLHAAMVAHESARPAAEFVKMLVCSEGLPAVRLHTQGPDFYDQTFMLHRGDLARKQGEATPGFLQVLMRHPDEEKHWRRPPPSTRTPGVRAALARWITDVDEGAGNLLARVIANRVWQHHFGRGIVNTPSDFGAMGAAPTHPELLEHLAGRLVADGWRLKPLHKLILLSATYQQGGDRDDARERVDVNNDLLWHFPRHRLEGEAIRDSILAVSGVLDRTLYGPGTLDEGMNRRSIYFKVKRSKLISWMMQFDWPDSLVGIGARASTTVAPQALLLMNNPHVRKAAEKFAKDLMSSASGPEGATYRAYVVALGRAPSGEELLAGLMFYMEQLKRYTEAGLDNPQLATMTDFCQTIFGLNEFVYVE